MVTRPDNQTQQHEPVGGLDDAVRIDWAMWRIQDLERQLANRHTHMDPALKQEPTYAFRRKGLDEFCTCSRERFDELSGKPQLFETAIFYRAPLAGVPLLEDDVIDAIDQSMCGEREFARVFAREVERIVRQSLVAVQQPAPANGPYAEILEANRIGYEAAQKVKRKLYPSPQTQPTVPAQELYIDSLGGTELVIRDPQLPKHGGLPK